MSEKTKGAVAAIGALFFIASMMWTMWQFEGKPRHNFKNYFGMSYPMTTAAEKAAMPTVINRLYEMHAALPEQELADLNRQITEAESRIDVSATDRDTYFRLLGRRDQLLKESQPRYDEFAAACDSAAIALSADGNEVAGKMLAKAHCPIYPSDF